MFSRVCVAAAFVVLGQSSVAQSESFDLQKAEKLSFFIPQGFDDNDEVTVVLDGMLPSTCHKLDRIESHVDLEKQQIVIDQLVRKYADNCVKVSVPFTSTLRLPALPFGRYLVVNSARSASRVIEVAESLNAGPDDHLYAPVEQISISEDVGSNHRYAVIEGRFTSTCMVWDEIKVVDANDTIVILPIVKMEQRPDCLDIEAWFKTSVDLPAKDLLGRYLVHSRSLNGRSQNLMFSTVPQPRTP